MMQRPPFLAPNPLQPSRLTARGYSRALGPIAVCAAVGPEPAAPPRVPSRSLSLGRCFAAPSAPRRAAEARRRASERWPCVRGAVDGSPTRAWRGIVAHGMNSPIRSGNFAMNSSLRAARHIAYGPGLWARVTARQGEACACACVVVAAAVSVAVVGLCCAVLVLVPGRVDCHSHLQCRRKRS